MPGISLSALRNERQQVRIRSKGNSLIVWIYPDRLSHDVMDRYSEAAQDEPRNYDEMAAALCEFVDEWDLVANEGDEEPLPINGETLRTMPVRVMNLIWDELTTAISPKSRKKNERS